MVRIELELIRIRLNRNEAKKQKKAVPWFMMRQPFNTQSIFQLKNAINTPAATAEPMTPATFGPIACINNTFDLSYS